jgi:hypothetical protein
MDINELHAVQEELAKKLEMTNSILGSKLASPKPPAPQGILKNSHQKLQEPTT